MAQETERQKMRYFKAARQHLALYQSRLRAFPAGEVFPRVPGSPIPGHILGRMADLIASGGESRLVWGYTVHVSEIRVSHPDVTMTFDSDPAAAAIMRHHVFEMVSTERFLIGGTHLHFPGFAHLARRAGGYRLVPE